MGHASRQGRQRRSDRRARETGRGPRAWEAADDPVRGLRPGDVEVVARKGKDGNTSVEGAAVAAGLWGKRVPADVEKQLQK